MPPSYLFFSPTFCETLWIALDSTLLLLIIGLPIAHWFARRQSRVPVLVETFVNLPVALAPALIGFYLFILFSPKASSGSFLAHVMRPAAYFSFPGLVAAGAIYSLPFAVQPFRIGLSRVSTALLDDARLSRASAFATFWHVTLPCAGREIAAGVLLSFAHTFAAFSIPLLVAAGLTEINMPASQAYGATLLAIAFLLILAVTLLLRRPVVSNQ